MHSLRRTIPIAVLFLVLLACSVAQAIVVHPANVSVEASRDDQPVRALVLSAGQNLTGLRFVPTDLASPDGQVLSADLVRVTGLPDAMANGSLQSVSVGLDLPNASSAGRYAGEIWFTSANATARVPVGVTVRDGWLLPLALLLAAVLVSVAVFTYEARGKKRDEVLQDLGVLSYHVRQDGEFEVPDGWRPNPFKSYLLDQVDAVDRKLQLGEVEEAATLLESAGEIWERWNTQRSPWHNAFANVHRFLAELVKYEREIQKEGPGASDLRVPPEIRFYADLRAALLREYDTAPAKERPAVLVDAVAALDGKEVRYRQVFLDLRIMAGTCERKESCDACLSRLHELCDDLLWLTPNDEFGPLEARAGTARAKTGRTLAERSPATRDPARKPSRAAGGRRPPATNTRWSVSVVDDRHPPPGDLRRLPLEEDRERDRDEVPDDIGREDRGEAPAIDGHGPRERSRQQNREEPDRFVCHLEQEYRCEPDGRPVPQHGEQAERDVNARDDSEEQGVLGGEPHGRSRHLGKEQDR